MSYAKAHLAILGIAMMMVIVACTGNVMPANDGKSLMKSFSSKEELEAFIKSRAEFSKTYPTWMLIMPLRSEDIASTTLEYSTTNVQIEGVDEADIVKTDGLVIYAASSDGWISIVKAYPPQEATLLSKIRVEGEIMGLFIYKERSARLIVVVREAIKENSVSERGATTSSLRHPWRVKVEVFDVSNLQRPTLAGEVVLEGDYISSRMIENYVYIVATYPIPYRELNITMPKWATNNVSREVSPSDVFYSDSIDVPTSFTLIAAIDVLDVNRAIVKAVLTGWATCMYMSKSNIYVAYPTVSTSIGTWSNTIIYRVAVNGLDITCKAKGEVPGKVLNQFSMDEFNGYFRVATTTYLWGINKLSFSMKTENNIYVLRADTLEIVGRLEGLAPGENIYSARFMSSRCYLVTFKKVDPLFTIDLSDPFNPKVLGALKIPGYSDYLHPYDESYLIGIGKETLPAEGEDFAWYQGLKISLFDVSNVEEPKELSKIIIGDRGTDSPVLRDHHALLFDKKRSLLVIPILEAKIFRENYAGEVPPWIHGEPVFQGAYVFHVSPEKGITLRGKVTHIKSGETINPYYEVKRALYINDILYTISDGMIKLNSLSDLSEIKSINLI